MALTRDGVRQKMIDAINKLYDEREEECKETKLMRTPEVSEEVDAALDVIWPPIQRMIDYEKWDWGISP